MTGVAVTLGAPFQTALIAAAVWQGVAALMAWKSRALPMKKTAHRPGRISLAVFTTRPHLLAPALVVLFALFIEGSMDVWSVLFLRETLGSSVMGGAGGSRRLRWPSRSVAPSQHGCFSNSATGVRSSYPGWGPSRSG
ncbi:MAG: hypothetical protein ACRDJV_11440 [Actinomycetota bacterium]